jgi:hypothetical protein
MKTKNSRRPEPEYAATDLLRRWIELRRDYWFRQRRQSNSVVPLPDELEQKVSSEAENGHHDWDSTLQDKDEIEEFPLLLKSSEVSALIEAARKQGLCAATFAREAIHQYLLDAQSNSAKGIANEQRLSSGRTEK